MSTSEHLHLRAQEYSLRSASALFRDETLNGMPYESARLLNPGMGLHADGPDTTHQYVTPLVFSFYWPDGNVAQEHFQTIHVRDRNERGLTKYISVPIAKQTIRGATIQQPASVRDQALHRLSTSVRDQYAKGAVNVIREHGLPLAIAEISYVSEAEYIVQATRKARLWYPYCISPRLALSGLQAAARADRRSW